jgi:hypothetical protein
MARPRNYGERRRPLAMDLQTLAQGANSVRIPTKPAGDSDPSRASVLVQGGLMWDGKWTVVEKVSAVNDSFG